MNVPKKYAKKVLTVSAMQFDGYTEAFKAFCQHDAFVDDMGLHVVHVVCVGGRTDPQEGDWLVRDENGVLSVLHPNTFAARYSEIVEA